MAEEEAGGDDNELGGGGKSVCLLLLYLFPNTVSHLISCLTPPGSDDNRKVGGRGEGVAMMQTKACDGDNDHKVGLVKKIIYSLTAPLI